MPTVADHVASTMRSLYERGLTTLSGGNVSCRDRGGTIWITPAATSKDAVRAEDVVAIDPDGSVRGPRRASSETPLHVAVYERRSDVHAVVHAHPPALVAFSVARRAPDPSILPAARDVVGPVALVPYALTGSAELGRVIAAAAGGADAFVLESHGVVVGGADLERAQSRLETLELLARIEIAARRLREQRSASPASGPGPSVPRLVASPPGRPLDRAAAEAAIRHLAESAARRGLLAGALARISVRLDDGALLLVEPPFDARAADRLAPRRVDASSVSTDGPAAMHAAVLRAHEAIHVVVEATPVHATAFAVERTELPSRTIPESLMLLGAPVPVVDRRRLPAVLSPGRPAALVAASGVAVVAATAVEALDRLEVIEATAQSVIDAHALGGPHLLDAADVDELVAGLRA